MTGWGEQKWARQEWKKDVVSYVASVWPHRELWSMKGTRSCSILPRGAPFSTPISVSHWWWVALEWYGIISLVTCLPLALALSVGPCSPRVPSTVITGQLTFSHFHSNSHHLCKNTLFLFYLASMYCPYILGTRYLWDLFWALTYLLQSPQWCRLIMKCDLVTSGRTLALSLQGCTPVI